MKLNDHINRFDDEHEHCDRYDRKSMESAPKDKIILLFNPYCGWFASKHDSDLKGSGWPLYNLRGNEGVWYPSPTAWADYNDQV